MYTYGVPIPSQTRHMYLLTDTREQSTPSERRSRSWLSSMIQPIQHLFFISISSKTSTSALIIGVFALGILSNQTSSFSHEMVSGLSVVILPRWKLLCLSLRPQVFGSCIAELRIGMRYCSLTIRYRHPKTAPRKICCC